MIWRWFWREWRSPSLLIVWLALTLAVAAVMAMSSVSERMMKGLNQQSREFMAGDRTLSSSYQIDESWLRQAQREGVHFSVQLIFNTMTFGPHSLQLAEVKAVDAAYPMYGELVTEPGNLKPQPGTVLVAPRLLALLALHTGDLLDIGDTSLRIAGTVLQEPDVTFAPLQTAPRVLINLQDVKKTGAVQPGSRVSWRYKFSGDSQQLERYEGWIKPQLKANQRWVSPSDAEDAPGRSMQRAQQFMQLSALLTLILAISAVAVAMSHYCRSRYDLVAVLKTLGAGGAMLGKLIIGQWLALLLLSAMAGSAIGLICEAILLHMLKPILPASLPSSGSWPWWQAISLLVIISLLVGLRPYRLLLATRPLRVLRRENINPVWPLKYYLPLQTLVVAGLLTLMVGSRPLLWGLLAAMLAVALLLCITGWGGLLLLRRFPLRRLSFRLAVNRLLRQPLSTLSQLAAFSFSFMLLALLLLLRGDLLERWQQQLPGDSPNYYLLNISTEQVPQVKHFLRQHAIKPDAFYPIVRVRLIEINGIPVDPDADNTYNRELNLTWLAQPPANSPVVAGNWPPEQGEVSMAEELTQRLGLKMGDTLSFSGDTQPFSAKISSLRTIERDSLRPFFFFIFPPGALDQQPQTWLTSFRLNAEPIMLVELNRTFPTLTVLDVNTILRQIGQVLAQVSRVLEILVVLVTACGVLLLLAQMQVGLQQRRQELVVYRTLGASSRMLYATLWAEYAIIGSVAGVTAAVGAEAALWGLQRNVFDFPWQPDFTLWLVLPLTGAVLLSLCGGWLGLRLLRGNALFRANDSI